MSPIRFGLICALCAVATLQLVASQGATPPPPGYAYPPPAYGYPPQGAYPPPAYAYPPQGAYPPPGYPYGYPPVYAPPAAAADSYQPEGNNGGGLLGEVAATAGGVVLGEVAADWIEDEFFGGDDEGEEE